MNISHFFDKDTATFTYVVSDSTTSRCAVIDPVLNYDPFSARISTDAADAVIEHIRKEKLTVEWILETHAHADHLTGAHYIKQKLGGKTGIGEHIKEVLAYWVPLFNLSHDTPLDGSQFDHLFKDGDHFTIGSLKVRVMHTPGHTQACVCYIVGDAVFVGDTIFMPNAGTARADFPGGDAAVLYRSIKKILSLPPETRIFMCHDYPSEGMDPSPVTTVADQNKKNRMVNEGVSEAEYIAARNKRDKELSVPRLLLPSLQVNMRAGNLGKMEDNGVRYIKIPLNTL